VGEESAVPSKKAASRMEVQDSVHPYRWLLGSRPRLHLQSSGATHSSCDPASHILQICKHSRVVGSGVSSRVLFSMHLLVIFISRRDTLLPAQNTHFRLTGTDREASIEAAKQSIQASTEVPVEQILPPSGGLIFPGDVRHQPLRLGRLARSTLDGAPFYYSRCSRAAGSHRARNGPSSPSEQIHHSCDVIGKLSKRSRKLMQVPKLIDYRPDLLDKGKCGKVGLRGKSGMPKKSKRCPTNRPQQSVIGQSQGDWDHLGSPGITWDEDTGGWGSQRIR
jgi:hypothetical protein